MKVKADDVLVCACEDCQVELMVQQACTKESGCGCGCGCDDDGDGCDIEVTCCDQPMVLKEKKSECCCGD